MQKGQISFDFILAIIAMLIFVGAFSIIATSVSDSQHKISIQNQERQIASSLAAIINSGRSLSDGSGSIEYEIGEVVDMRNPAGGSCTVGFDADAITVTYRPPGQNPEDIITVFPVELNGISLPGSAPCGGQITIDYGGR